MMSDLLQGERFRVDCADALEWMSGLPDQCADLILTDPPYFRVKDEPWDRHWDTPEGFLDWMGELCRSWKRLLKPNGSLYVFASPQMGTRVESEVRKYFNVLNFITWSKPMFSTKAELFDKDTMRAFFPASERLIFADHYGSDENAKEQAGYHSQCDLILRTTKKQVFGEYLQSEFDRAGATKKEIAALFPSRTGKPTGCVSNWVLGFNCPTLDQYLKMRGHLNQKGRTEYLKQDYVSLKLDYEGLKLDYEDLKRNYEDLKQDYENLRRPFNAHPAAPYTDVWDFPTVGQYFGKHPCEKPLPLLEHIISVSSRPEALVLDCFCGSGNVGKAALSLERRFIGCDFSPKWAQFARERIGTRQLSFMTEEAA